MQRLVILGEKEQDDLLAMKKFAREHPLSFAEVQRLTSVDLDKEPLYLHTKEHYCQIPFGMEVGMTYEEQRKDDQPFYLWHVSYSIKIPGRVPHPEACNLINKILGLPRVQESLMAQNFSGVMNVWFMDGAGERALAE